MAEGKKGFILYADQKEIFKQLSDQKAGILIKHIFKYVNDESPTSKDIIINLAFTPIKQQLKRDLNTYENICERNRLNGQKGGRPKNPKNPKEPKEPSGLLGNPKEPKEPDTDNDIDNDNDIVNAFIKNVYSVSDELLMSKSIVGDFLNHWTEKDYENKCFAWQVPETFIIKSRLKGWKKNNDKSKPIKEKNPFLL